MKGWRMIHEIKKRLSAGVSVSEVARKLGIDRKTVRKYRDLETVQVKQQRKAAQQRTGKIDRFKKWLKSRVKEYEAEGIVNCECLYRELKEMGFTGAPRTVRRYVKGLRTKGRKRVFEPFETEPGKQAMVDMGERRKLLVGEKRQTVYFIVMALSHSRKKYGEWYDQPISTEMLLSFHQRAFASFGGIPAEIVYDQTKLAVLRERYGECDFNSEFYGFCRHYHIEPYICNGYDPQTKGKIESVVKYAKYGFLPGRSFQDTSDLQRQWDQWVAEVADVKVHETTGRPPVELWEQEREHLQPVPADAYEVQPSYESRKVLDNGLIKVLGNRYSVPQQYQGKRVGIRVTAEKIHIHAPEGAHLYTHWRARTKGKTYKIKDHYKKVYAVSTALLEKQVVSIYDSRAVLKELKQRFPRHYREQLKGLIRLEKETPQETLRQALTRALVFNSVSLGNIERIIRGIDADKINIPPVESIRARSLGTGVRVRDMSYYARAAAGRHEEV